MMAFLLFLSSLISSVIDVEVCAMAVTYVRLGEELNN